MRTRTTRRSAGILAAGLAACVLALLLANCARTPPEQSLRQAVAALQSSVEARQAGAIRELLADDFIGPDGMDREAAVRLAQLSFLQHPTVGATVGPLHIVLSPSARAPDHATVEFSAALTGGPGAGLPGEANLYDVRTGWRLQSGDWRMTSADWKPAL
ncbi:nuclear transport factor 2 family protein [Cognatiluteimonas profundi]|uniref:nuclear transport factor 2 family protein n=1 Tax=Cognatiluteimonas profundi TaxID=2594501 RepID=UPI00131CB789|nr:nuclear transport factor 2 family protein [Lysobacter profundi]